MNFMYKKHDIGKCGETFACRYLEENNYDIIERNFSCMQGEIDIIAYDKPNSELVFFEVKTRSNFSYGFPCEAVNTQKQKHIKNCVKYYLYSRIIEDVFIRIDVIEIVFRNNKYKLNHLKGVL